MKLECTEPTPAFSNPGAMARAEPASPPELVMGKFGVREKTWLERFQERNRLKRASAKPFNWAIFLCDWMITWDKTSAMKMATSPTNQYFGDWLFGLFWLPIITAVVLPIKLLQWAFITMPTKWFRAFWYGE